MFGNNSQLISLSTSVDAHFCCDVAFAFVLWQLEMCCAICVVVFLVGAFAVQFRIMHLCCDLGVCVVAFLYHLDMHLILHVLATVDV